MERFAIVAYFGNKVNTVKEYPTLEDAVREWHKWSVHYGTRLRLFRRHYGIDTVTQKNFVYYEETMMGFNCE